MSTILIIGAGPNIGLATAMIFASAGYQVAIASRTKTSDSYKHFFFDASKPETVPQLFAEIRKEFGDPKVVVYNAVDFGEADNEVFFNLAYSRTATPENPFSLTLEEYAHDTNINATSVYAAAKEAVEGFSKTGPGSTFIFTGNKLNVAGFSHSLVFGMGKSASAHLIRAANNSFEGKGYNVVL
ncbi:hypothetical protein PFICI_09005 [Pestalotiopsis fici W106-1]|uniref:NAD(P)-binding protein n=1 Tax=Pestalotiopsis fici (strain W106-1 / CGMCC3.15140) TaxID=1229662 RepID=W3X178_PESFW|nr:uncharacterized protein PFICI_09005 [Pestalotiopsis fici W106-1]ETS79152.1 hypothetical protein PFICI_09005 [Pestalotiopsis fici W106-1]